MLCHSSEIKTAPSRASNSVSVDTRHPMTPFNTGVNFVGNSYMQGKYT